MSGHRNRIHDTAETSQSKPSNLSAVELVDGKCLELFSVTTRNFCVVEVVPLDSAPPAKRGMPRLQTLWYPNLNLLPLYGLWVSLPHCLIALISCHFSNRILHTWKCPHLFWPSFSLDPTYYRWMCFQSFQVKSPFPMVTSSEAWRDTCSGHTLLLEHSSTGGKLRQGVETRLARLGNTKKIQWHYNIHNFTPNIPLYLRWFLVILGLIGTSQLWSGRWAEAGATVSPVQELQMLTPTENGGSRWVGAEWMMNEWYIIIVSGTRQISGHQHAPTGWRCWQPSMLDRWQMFVARIAV